MFAEFFNGPNLRIPLVVKTKKPFVGEVPHEGLYRVHYPSVL